MRDYEGSLETTRDYERLSETTTDNERLTETITDYISETMRDYQRL